MSTVADTPVEERAQGLVQTTLALEDMTCASCASRIERALNKVEGAKATVNFATETATVAYDPAIASPDRLIEAVEKIGYHARTRADREAEKPGDETPPIRLVAALTLSVPLVLLAMISPLQFSGWEWLALALATPVVFWSGIQFHRAALLNARHGVATMDTLVSIGTLAAWTWSAVVLFGGIDADSYFEVAAVITALILLGRYFEARAKRRVPLVRFSVLRAQTLRR